MRRERQPKEWTEARSQIFALFNCLGIDNDDGRHRIQHAVTGCSSLRFMTDKEHRLLVKVLETLTNHPPVRRKAMLRHLLAYGTSCHADSSVTHLPPNASPEFAHINLEAALSLVDHDSERVPVPRYPVALIVRQGVEALLKDKNGNVEAVAFLEYHQGQVRLLVWDETRDPFDDPPIIHILKDGNSGEAS